MSRLALLRLGAATCLEGVYSEHFTGELVELRDKLSPFSGFMTVAEFLAKTA